MRVVTYIRVSSVGQVEGDGPERQIAAIRQFTAKHGLVQHGQFAEAISGTIEGMDRPEFSKLLELIDTRAGTEHPIEAMVVERMDRLARDLMVGELMMRELRKRKVQLFATDQGTLTDMASDGDDPTRVLIRQFMGALAQWEKSSLVKKLTAAKQRIKAQGLRCDGAKPYGQNANERAILQLLINLTDMGTLTATGIARLFNDGGFKTRQGTEWTRQAIEYLQKAHTKKGPTQ